MKTKRIVLIILVLFIIILTYVLYRCNIIPHKKYTNEDFNISTYTSTIDKDADGIDDQTDILNNAFDYVATNPKYKSKYYATGYPNDEYGVCTDVVAIALKNAGYDLQELINEDVKEDQEAYEIEVIDKNIDFRRVENLNIYLKRHALSLTTYIHKIMEWQGGDIVVFKGHIGVISDYRNARGVPFVLHHAHPYQRDYEEDILELEQKKIIGHYRIS